MLCLLASLSSVSATAATRGVSKAGSNPNLRSNAFYIFDESDSKVLAARNERNAVPIASITKLMTSLVVLEAHQPMGEVITISRADVVGTRGSSSRLAPGTRLSQIGRAHV